MPRRSRSIAGVRIRTWNLVGESEHSSQGVGPCAACGPPWNWMTTGPVVAHPVPRSPRCRSHGLRDESVGDEPDRGGTVRASPSHSREPAHGAILDGVDLCGPAPITGNHRDLIPANGDCITNDLAGEGNRRLPLHRHRGSTTRWRAQFAAMCAGVDRQFALLKDAIEASDGVFFNMVELTHGFHAAWVSSVRARRTRDAHGSYSRAIGFVARERVTVDPEIRREGDLKKGRPPGRPSPDA